MKLRNLHKSELFSPSSVNRPLGVPGVEVQLLLEALLNKKSLTVSELSESVARAFKKSAFLVFSARFETEGIKSEKL